MRLRFSLFATLLGPVAAAQTVDVGARVTVSGVIYDSLALAPLAGAAVQLVGSDNPARFARTVMSDSLGRYVIGDVPSGRFMVGFFHPVLDALGISVPARAVTVDSDDVRADLAIPSAPVLRTALCGPTSPGKSGGVMVGVVRSARDRAPVAGATVIADWVELTITRAGFVRRTPRVTTTAESNGWFALCGVPGPATIFVVASRGADSTDAIELEVPRDGLLRRELYVGPSRVADAAVTGQDTDGGRASGTVVAAVENRPITGARVSVLGGHETAANDAGAWTLAGVSLGTRMLEVRALGYYPKQVVVDVVPGAPPLRTTLSTMKAVLDTVRITASRLNDPHQSGFAERRHSGMGRYLTQEHVKRYQPLVTSDLFRFTSGVYVERVGAGDARVSMRGLFTSRCGPAIYLDGHYMRGLSAEDINSWVGPDEIAGIEVYSAGMVPAQFSPGMTGCGAIVIWTQPSTHGPDARSKGLRFLILAGGITLGLLVGATLK